MVKGGLALAFFTLTLVARSAMAEDLPIAADSTNESPISMLPPDFFLAPGQSGEKYVFPTKLEVPCSTTKSKFCPNNGPDGIPSDWVIARYKSRHSGGFDCGTSSLLMVYIPPGSLVKGQRDRVHRWLNFALPSDTSVPETCNNPYYDPEWPSFDPAAIIPAADLQPTPRSPIPTAYDNSMPRTFTMVSLTEGDTANVHFAKFQRSGDDTFYTPDSPPHVQGCYGCHPNGLRAISPLGYHVDASEAADPENKMLEEANWQAVKKINDAMERAEGGMAVKWDQEFDPSTQKQLVGPSTPKNPKTRSKEYILGNDTQPGCAKAKLTYDMTDIFRRVAGNKNVYTMNPNANLDWEKIRDAMNCESCHDHTQRGAITVETGVDQINFKLLVDQSMPQGSLKDLYSSATDRSYSNSLDLDHRIALANCLRQELEDSSN